MYTHFYYTGRSGITTEYWEVEPLLKISIKVPDKREGIKVLFRARIGVSKKKLKTCKLFQIWYRGIWWRAFFSGSIGYYVINANLQSSYVLNVLKINMVGRGNYGRELWRVSWLVLLTMKWRGVKGVVFFKIIMQSGDNLHVYYCCDYFRTIMWAWLNYLIAFS